MCVCVCIQWDIFFDPLLIISLIKLYVYNFNGRFILTVRDNNDKIIQKKMK